MSLQENKEAVRRLIDIFNAHDSSRMGEVCDENIVYRTASGIELRGLDAFQDVIHQIHEAFPDARFLLQELFGEDEHLHATYRFKGTHQGEFFGIPASGNQADYLVAAVFRFEEGRLVEEFDFYDGLTFLRNLGVLSKEVRPGGSEWPTGGMVLRPQRAVDRPSSSPQAHHPGQT